MKTLRMEAVIYTKIKDGESVDDAEDRVIEGIDNADASMIAWSSKIVEDDDDEGEH